MPLRRFYHADRNGSLVSGQTVDVDQNGYSRFARGYLKPWATTPRASWLPAVEREFVFELIRARFYGDRPSRLKSFFCAEYLDDALRHAATTLPLPSNAIAVHEVFSESEPFLADRHWLDFALSEKTEQHAHLYWTGAIATHAIAEDGAPADFLIEALLPLPVKIGGIVRWCTV